MSACRKRAECRPRPGDVRREAIRKLGRCRRRRCWSSSAVWDGTGKRAEQAGARQYEWAGGLAGSLRRPGVEFPCPSASDPPSRRRRSAAWAECLTGTLAEGRRRADIKGDVAGSGSSSTRKASAGKTSRANARRSAGSLRSPKGVRPRSNGGQSPLGDLDLKDLKEVDREQVEDRFHRPGGALRHRDDRCNSAALKGIKSPNTGSRSNRARSALVQHQRHHLYRADAELGGLLLVR
jgi:hypothetical protein